MATKKTASKPIKKAAAKKPVKKAVVKKTVAKKPVKKVAAKKAAPASKAKTASKVAKKATKNVKKTTVKPAAKKVAALKAAPKPKTKAVKAAAKPIKKVAVKKPATKTASKPVKKKTAKPVPAPVKKATPVKAPAKAANVAKAEKMKSAPKPVVRKRAKSAPEPKTPAKPLVTQGVGPSMPRVTPMVKKIVSTLEAGDKDRYSDTDLEEFRTIINAKLDEARKDFALLKQTLANTDNNGTEDTSPSFKMIEDGSETLGREETAQLAGRQEKFIKHLEDALLRIRNKTYGICRVTGKLISKERLRLVPHATLSIEAKQQMSN